MNTALKALRFITLMLFKIKESSAVIDFINAHKIEEMVFLVWVYQQPFSLNIFLIGIVAVWGKERKNYLILIS